MCDVGETSVLPSSGTVAATTAVFTRLCRPSCDQQQQQQQQQQTNITGGLTMVSVRSTPSTPTSLRRDAQNLEKCFSEPEFFRKHHQHRRQHGTSTLTSSVRKVACTGADNNLERDSENERTSSSKDTDNLQLDGHASPIDVISDSVKVTNGTETKSKYTRSEEHNASDSRKDLMAPVLGVPPPPPPAPHMGPDGLILPRKPYNPCLTSSSHKDLRRELLFNQKMGKNVLNQKSELERALERHREMVSRKEAERVQEESYKNDPRTALQRAIEQRAKHILQSQQPQSVEPTNPLANARAKLRSRTDLQ